MTGLLVGLRPLGLRLLVLGVAVGFLEDGVGAGANDDGVVVGVNDGGCDGHTDDTGSATVPIDLGTEGFQFMHDTDVHPSNARSPIVITLSGIVILVIAIQ